MNRLQTIMDVTRALNPNLKYGPTVRTVKTYYVGWSDQYTRRQGIARATLRAVFEKRPLNENA